MSDDYNNVFSDLNLADMAAEQLRDPILNWMAMADSGLQVADLALSETLKGLEVLKREAGTHPVAQEAVEVFQDIIDHLTEVQSDIRQHCMAGLSDQTADVKFFQDLAEKVSAPHRGPSEGRVVRKPRLKLVEPS